MASDNSVALQAKAPSLQDSLAPISAMIGVQQKSAEWNARQSIGDALSDPNLRDENGQIDLTKAMPALLQADPMNFHATDIVKSIADSRIMDWNSKLAQQHVAQNDRDVISSAAGALIDKLNGDPSLNPAKEAIKVWTGLRKQGAITPETFGLAIDRTETSPGDMVSDEAKKQYRSRFIAGLEQLQKSGVSASQLESQQVLPANTQVADDAGQPTFVGNRVSGAPNRQGPLHAAPPLGASAAATGAAQDINNRYARLAGNAAGAGTIEGLFKNIRGLSDDALTGQGAKKLSVLQGWWNTVTGGKGGDITKAATDEINKQMAQLTDNSQLATDAARAIHQMAVPNQEMNARAIRNISAQLIGQTRAVKAAKDYMDPHLIQATRGNLQDYLNAESKLNNIDARVKQAEFLKDYPQEFKEWWASLKPQDRVDIKKKTADMIKMGLAK